MTAAILVNSLIVLGIFVLLGYATANRPGPLTSGVTAALTISLVLIGTLPKHDQLSALLAVDAGLVAFAAHIARNGTPTEAEPARIVMAIGALKIAFVISGVLLDLGHNVRAAARNGAFCVQIFVAGGMADGFLAWVGHRGRIIGDRARRVLHRMEGE